MSDAEDEPGSSQADISTRKHTHSSGRRPRSMQTHPTCDLDEIEKKELLRKYAETDQNLEKFAQTHNMTALNVKSILRSVIKNHRALARVLGTDAPEESIDGVRITRSKTRALQHSSNKGVDMTSNVPIRRGHSWVDLRFNEDDEYDNDYRPGDESGDEMGSDSSHLGSSDDDEESENMSEFDKDEEEHPHDGINKLTVVENDGEESTGGINSFELFSRGRPESSASLTLNAIIGEDDEPSADVDYHQFVNSINLDNIPYNDDEDPEYMVPTEAIFRDERDEWAGDYWSSTIPQKEMEGLIEDIVPSERFGELAKNLGPPPRQGESTRNKTAASGFSCSVESGIEAEMGQNVFTHHHRMQLRGQMEQHVQLLTQSFVGCYFEPLLQEEKEKSRKMIESLTILSSTADHFGKKSAFYISNLAFAVDTCDRMVDKKPATSIKPLDKEDLTISHSMHSITKEVLGTSKAIIYPHIVSQHRLVQNIGSNGWNRNEQILFAMALYRYKDEPESHRLPQKGRYSIIAENCLPWRTMNELRWQYNGMKRGLKRNGKTRHNKHFFDVAEGEARIRFCPPLRAKSGWTMMKWQKNALPSWFNYQRMKRKCLDMIDSDQGKSPENKKMRNERRIEDGDEEMEAIVILDSDEEEDGGYNEVEIIDNEEEIEANEEESDENRGEMGDNCGKYRDREDQDELAEKDLGEEVKLREERKEMKNNEMLMYSMEDDECAMDSTDKSGLVRSPDEIEEIRGDEKGEGQPIDFSHLMREMSPSGRSQLKTPSPRREERAPSTTPSEKTILPRTPGKRFPSPSEESTPWLDLTVFRDGFASPPLSHSPPTSSRIKTPGGTMDYEDSLMGYFGTPEREIEGDGHGDRASTSKKSSVYSNLFGDFDFDDSIGEEGMAQSIVNEELIERKECNEKSEERAENESDNLITTIEDKSEAQLDIPIAAPVKKRKKRTTREEKEKIGLAAINDATINRRVRNALAKKTAEDVRSRMNMHSSVLREIQFLFSQNVEKGNREKIFKNLIPLLSEDHKEVLYLLSAFAPPSYLPRSLLISRNRRVYVDAINIMCTIFAYMSKIQRRLSYRQLLKLIVEAHSSGGNEKVHNTLKEVLVNDPLLMRVLSQYFTPSIPSEKSPVWECIDLRKGEEAFHIIKENRRIERVDMCEVMGTALTKKMLVKKGKPLSTIMLNHDGEPLLRNEDGKYKAIAVMTEGEREEEMKSILFEREEEKKAKQREKVKEKRDAAKKAKKAVQREERAKEKKMEKERKVVEEERKKEEKEAPPNHPWNRDIDKALLIMYNEVQKVTKRAVRKVAVDLPYFSNFTIEQLQARLDFLLNLAGQD